MDDVVCLDLRRVTKIYIVRNEVLRTCLSCNRAMPPSKVDVAVHDLA